MIATKFLRWSAGFSTTVLCSLAGAEQLPDQTDLRAAYCIPIVKSWIALLPSQDSPIPASATPAERQSTEEINQFMAKMRTQELERLRRLQLYVIPRLSYLDTTSMMAAMKSGEEDVARASFLADQCTTKCSGQGSACISECGKNSSGELTARMKACSNTTWLPF